MKCERVPACCCDRETSVVCRREAGARRRHDNDDQLACARARALRVVAFLTRRRRRRRRSSGAGARRRRCSLFCSLQLSRVSKEVVDATATTSTTRTRPMLTMRDRRRLLVALSLALLMTTSTRGEPRWTEADESRRIQQVADDDEHDDIYTIDDCRSSWKNVEFSSPRWAAQTQSATAAVMPAAPASRQISIQTLGCPTFEPPPPIDSAITRRSLNIRVSRFVGSAPSINMPSVAVQAPNSIVHRAPIESRPAIAAELRDLTTTKNRADDAALVASKGEGRQRRTRNWCYACASVSC